MVGPTMSQERNFDHTYDFRPLDKKLLNHGVRSLSWAWGFASMNAMNLLHA
jgi:hypothetical protein